MLNMHTCNRINGNTNNITGRLEIDTECLDHVRSLRRWSTETSERAETSTGLGGEGGACKTSGRRWSTAWRAETSTGLDGEGGACKTSGGRWSTA